MNKITIFFHRVYSFIIFHYGLLANKVIFDINKCYLKGENKMFLTEYLLNLVSIYEFVCEISANYISTLLKTIICS